MGPLALWALIPSWGKKALMIAAAVALGFWLLRQHDNRVRNEAEAKERQNVTQQLTKQHEAEMVILRQEISAEREVNKKEAERLRAEVAKGFAEQEDKFLATTKKLQTTIVKIDEERKKRDENLSHVTDDQLDDFLRDLSGSIGTSSTDNK